MNYYELLFESKERRRVYGEIEKQNRPVKKSKIKGRKVRPLRKKELPRAV